MNGDHLFRAFLASARRAGRALRIEMAQLRRAFLFHTRTLGTFHGLTRRRLRHRCVALQAVQLVGMQGVLLAALFGMQRAQACLGFPVG